MFILDFSKIVNQVFFLLKTTIVIAIHQNINKYKKEIKHREQKKCEIHNIKENIKIHKKKNILSRIFFIEK